MRNIKYTIVDIIHALAIKHDKYEIELFMLDIKWQQNYSWYGEQDWMNEVSDYRDRTMLKKIFIKLYT